MPVISLPSLLFFIIAVVFWLAYARCKTRAETDAEQSRPGMPAVGGLIVVILSTWLILLLLATIIFAW